MSIIISDILDVTEDTVADQKSNLSMNNVMGILAQVKNYLIRDNKGEVSAFSTQGFLFRNFWRDQTVKETGVDSNPIFTGVVKQTGWRHDNFGFQAKVQAQNSVGVFLQFQTDEADVFEQDGATGLSLFEVDGAHPVGSTDIAVTYEGANPGATEVPTPSLVAFTDSLIPRYQVLEQTSAGAPLRTTSIKLDRALEVALVDDQQITVTIPVNRTPAAAMKRALISAGLGAFVGSSFDLIDASDAANGFQIWMHILTTDNISLASHLAKLLELGDLWLTFNEQTGGIDVVRGLAWDGLAIATRATDNEFIGREDLDFDSSNLIAAYQTFYVSGAEIGEAKGEVDQTIIDQYANSKPWQPIKPKARMIMGENYLYSNAPTADFFGQRRLDYFGVPRTRFKASLKPSESGQNLKLYNLQLLSQLAVTFRTAENQFFIDEPARVVAYTFDEDRQVYPMVTLEFTNYLAPNITRDVTFPTVPVLT